MPVRSGLPTQGGPFRDQRSPTSGRAERDRLVLVELELRGSLNHPLAEVFARALAGGASLIDIGETLGDPGAFAELTDDFD